MKQQLSGPTHVVVHRQQRQPSPPISEHTQNQERTIKPQTQTYQSSRLHTKRTHIIEDDPNGHPFIDEIIEAQLPPN